MYTCVRRVVAPNSRTVRQAKSNTHTGHRRRHIFPAARSMCSINAPAVFGVLVWLFVRARA